MQSLTRRLLSVLFLTAVFTVPALGCTNLIVGKRASADGSVMITYNADDYGSYGFIHFYAGGRHAKGEMRPLYDYETNNYLGEIPEADYTYNVVGQINEHQLAIMETTFGGREELVDTTGLLDYGSLMYLTLQRARTAREAIDVWTSLMDTYGYRSEGESITLADPNEVWIMELIGKGPGNKGAVWVARRLPDDCITAHANQARITTFPLNDKANCVYSKDVIKVARERGYFSGKDSEFSFRDAYAPNDFSARRICEARVWSFFNRFCTGMDKYIPYAAGIEEGCEEMPWCIRPDTLVTLNALKQAMRDHFEGTPFDMTSDISSGPYEAPYRPTPLFYEVDGKKYFNERPISTQQTAVTYIAQLRSWLPNHVGGLLWVGCDDANMVSYTPVYCCASQVPQCYAEGTANPFTFSIHSAYWLCNAVSNFVYPRYSQLFPELQHVRDRLDADLEAVVLRTDREVASMSEEQARQHLTAFGLRSAQAMMIQWQQLFERLIVKYNDICIKPEDNGQYLRTSGGDHVPVQRPGFNEPYRRAIVNATGDRYLVPEE
ncbi:MAG: C69 family dipeptidase [Bacteroidaceae bacterium]|nr:C69 family dipeptidase [Bacteroidaceae bacterium]